MIRGPWPMSACQTKYEIPLERPLLTPVFQGERVALRVSVEDHAKFHPHAGDLGIITDLDTGKRYTLRGRACNLKGCYCDAEIVELTTTG